MSGSHQQPPTERGSVITMTRLRALSFIVLAIAIGTLLGASSRVQQVHEMLPFYEDFDTELPSITLTAVSVPPNVYYGGCALLIVVLLVKEFCLRDKGICLLINVAVIVLASAGWILIEQAAVEPMKTLMQSVSK